MEEEKTENVCEEQKTCKCEKHKCVFKAIVLILLLVIACLCFKISRDMNTLMVVTGIKAQAQAQAQSDFKISKKYDKGQSFDKALKKNKPMIVWFYVDWCGYCKRFAPTFDKLVKDKAIKDKFAVAFVNCDDEKNTELIQEYGIQGYPTVFLVNPETNTKEQLDGHDFFNPKALDILKDKLTSWDK